MKEWIKNNKHVFILYIVVFILVAALVASVIVINNKSCENEKNVTKISNLTSQNIKKDEETKKVQSDLDAAKKENENLKKQNEELKKQNIELTAKKKAAAEAAKRAKQKATTVSTKKNVSPPPATNPPAAKHTCYLTFDDGPSSSTTPQILNTLKAKGVKATFFVVGTGNLSLLNRMKNEGHAIGLHANVHDYGRIYQNVNTYLADLQAVSDKVYNITGIRSQIIRFPGGSSNTVSRKYCKGIMTQLSKLMPSKGYSYFDWNVSSGDAEGASVQGEINNVLRYANGNDICVLMHDIKPRTVSALPTIIDKLRAKGYKFEVLTPTTRGFHHGINN